MGLLQNLPVNPRNWQLQREVGISRVRTRELLFCCGLISGWSTPKAISWSFPSPRWHVKKARAVADNATITPLKLFYSLVLKNWTLNSAPGTETWPKWSRDDEPLCKAEPVSDLSRMSPGCWLTQTYRKCLVGMLSVYKWCGLEVRVSVQ